MLLLLHVTVAFVRLFVHVSCMGLRSNDTESAVAISCGTPPHPMVNMTDAYCV